MVYEQKESIKKEETGTCVSVRLKTNAGVQIMNSFETSIVNPTSNESSTKSPTMNHAPVL